MSEWLFLFFILSLFATLFFIQNLPDFPSDMKILSNWNYLILVGSIITIAGTCVVATGIPCTVAFLTTSGINIAADVFLSPVIWLSALLFIPLTVTLLYVFSRLARGGG